MKRVYKYLFVFLGSLFIFPLVSNAQCSYERQAELSKIAANVKFSYTYDTTNGFPTFNVIITNLTNDIYVEHTNDMFGSIISGVGEKQFSSTNGDNLTFDIYSNDNNCRGTKIMTQYLNLPKYNDLSNREECKENPDFKYCQVWNDNENITSENFDTSLKKYKNDHEDTQKTNDSDVWSKIKIFLLQNKIILITSGICIIILVIYGVYRFKQRRN